MEEAVESDGEEKCDSADVVDDDLSESIESISEDQSLHDDKTIKTKEFHASSLVKNELIPITELDDDHLKSEIDDGSKLVIKDVESSMGDFETEEKVPDEKVVEDVIDVSSSHRNRCNNNKPSNNENSNGKKKMKEGKPFSKVVVRRLPGSMTKEVFLEQVSPLPSHDCFYFVPSNVVGPTNFSRAYLNFTDQNDLLNFTRTFDNYVFVDNKGHEYPAVVEFAPYQRVPRERGRKKDPLMGTIEKEAVYTTFKEQLVTEALETSKPIVKQHYFETEINESEEVKTTPLLDYLRTRRAERVRLREEKREERRRREADRKRQRLQRERQEQDQEHDQSPAPDVKVLQHPKEKKEVKEKEAKKFKGKDKDDKNGKHTEGRPRDFKNKGAKGFKEEKVKQVEKREDKKRKSDEVKDEEEVEEEASVPEEEKVLVEKKKWKNGEKRARRKEEKKKEAYEKKRAAKGFKSRKGSGDMTEETKAVEKVTLKEGSCRDTKEGITTGPEQNNAGNRPEDVSEHVDLPDSASERLSMEGRTSDSKSLEVPSKEDRPSEDRVSEGKPSKENRTAEAKQSKENRAAEAKTSKENRTSDAKPSKEKRTAEGKHSKENSTAEAKSSSKENRSSETRPSKEERGSDGKTSKEGKTGKEDKGKDPRAQRRIRNKDRPSIEIYRPGMGKFSRQRIGKDSNGGGAAGTVEESPAHSPSPSEPS